MFQFQILSGPTAGTTWVARRFPVRVGRAAAADLRLEGDGVWEDHLQLSLDPATGIELDTRPDTLVSVNGEQVRRAILRNGDTLEVGVVTLRFWLGRPSQPSLRLREWLTWSALAGITLGQVALIYWLL